jgi:hypothetical protein
MSFKEIYKNKLLLNGIIFIIFLVISVKISNIPFIYNAYTSSITDAFSTTTILLNKKKIVHIATPEPVKAVYMTSWVAGNTKLRDKIINLIDKTEINSIVIDIKDYTGRISFKVDDEKLKAIGSVEERIPDIVELIDLLHEKNIYVIGRISSFQDSYFVKKFPQYAVKTKSGEVWKDYKGISWLDAGAEPVWEYLVNIGNEAYSKGFDELNFDYIRFPSDGNMIDISYTFGKGRNRIDVMKDFYAFIDKSFRPKGIPISADLFGMTTSNSDDLGIGQILGNALIHFDYVAPMIYPSHYPPNFNGWPNPAKKPYDVIKFALERGMNKATIASTSPNKLRPWLQDFGINGVPYTPDMVREQIKATYDVGLTSWMMWNASNNYSLPAYEVATSTGV